MKDKIGLIIFIAVVFIFYAFSAWSQYSWSERFKDQVGPDWIVFDEQKNAASFIYPYTLFAPPVNRLGLIQKSSVEQIGDEIYMYTKMWADGPVGNSLPGETFINFADCSNNLSGNFKEGVATFSSLEDVEWSTPDDNPYVSNETDKRRLVEVFNHTCEILNGL